MNTHDLFQHAKEDLLTDGEQQAPILYVEYLDASGEECLSIFYFAGFGAETPMKEKQQMFGLGMKFGEEHGPLLFTQLAMIAEAWVAYVTAGEKRTWKRPVDAPNRREALVMHLVEIQPTPDGKGDMKQSIKQAEIIRHGSIIDLGEVTDDYEIKSLTLPAYFLAGYSGSQLPAEELARMWQQTLKEFS